MVYLLCGCGSKAKKASSGYTYLQWGEYLQYYGKMDSAFLIFSRAANSTTDSLEKGKAYQYMGIMQRNTGDLYGALQSLAAALEPLDIKNEEHRNVIASVYNELGNTSIDLRKYNEAISFYDTALATTTEKNYILEIMNGKATALQKEGGYDDAIAIYDSILHLEPDNKVLTARAISNRAKTKWLQNSGYPALDEYRLALKIRVDSQDNRGLNASYAHLSDYYARIRPDSALFYAQKMHEKAKEIESPDDILEAIDKLIRLNSSSVLKEQWYEEFRKINDSLQLSRDTTTSRFALIKHDVQKSKADNLLLQQHITRQRVLMYGLIALAVVIITGLSIWYHKRRKRIKQESENAIRDSKLKTSQKVHDVVANGLYVIMNELEHSKMLDKDPLIARIEGLYEKSRNISYEEISSDSNVDYDNQIHDLFNDFTNDQTEVFVVGNQPTFWHNINGMQKNELLLILNEIMVNMKKHSGANSVVIRFKQEDNKGFIYYNDNGGGFPPGFEFGNGLKNTVSRIKSLNGEVIFGKSGKGGVSITISFPLESGKL
jgi:tetratricopeptide (TPR) repeat protein